MVVENKNSKIASNEGLDIGQILNVKPKKFAFLGYEVGGWGALLAFIISIITLGLTAVDRWLLSSNPIAIPPEQINIVCQKHDQRICPTNNNLYILGVPIILINDTAAPHSFTVTSSDVTFEVLDEKATSMKSIELSWQFIGDPTKPIGAITVAPQQNVSSEIQYHPRRTFDQNGNLIKENFWTFSDFQNFIAKKNAKSLRFTFKFELLGKDPVNELFASCVVPLDPDFKSNAALGTFLLFSRECFAD